MIYGNALGAPAESVQVPTLVRHAKASGVARYIGRGLNRWSNVHIADVAALYVLALAQAPPSSFYTWRVVRRLWVTSCVRSRSGSGLAPRSLGPPKRRSQPGVARWQFSRSDRTAGCEEGLLLSGSAGFLSTARSPLGLKTPSIESIA
jgi:hypothetical protein